MNDFKVKISGALNSEIILTKKSPLVFFVGPCVIESRDMIFRHAEKVSEIMRSLNANFVFKASYDKANRTSASSFRGLGVDEGLKILEEVRKEFSLSIVTDVHSIEEVNKAKNIVDVLQIPAFLCRQTDLLTEAGKTNKPILIKKGQFLHPSDMKYALDKVSLTGNSNSMVCERGTCFGYRDLVVDFRSFSFLSELSCPVIYDVTHSVQVIGGASGKSSGNSNYIPSLARAAVSYGIDGLFLECHENPSQAMSDGPNMLPLDLLKSFVEDIQKIESLNFNLN